MFEARLTEGIVFKQIIESINSLVNDGASCPVQSCLSCRQALVWLGVWWELWNTDSFLFAFLSLSLSLVAAFPSLTVNIDCTEDEMVIQCMDSAHVSLVYISLNAAAFEHFRCDREQKLGFNTSNMSKIMKMMGRNDALVLKAEEEAESLSMMFENEKCGTISDFGTFDLDVWLCRARTPVSFRCLLLFWSFLLFFDSIS